MGDEFSFPVPFDQKNSDGPILVWSGSFSVLPSLSMANRVARRRGREDFPAGEGVLTRHGKLGPWQGGAGLRTRRRGAGKACGIDSAIKPKALEYKRVGG